MSIVRVYKLLLISFYVALLLDNEVVAQTTYGFRIGVNIASLDGNFESSVNPESTVGLLAGSFAKTALRNDFAVQVEVLYSTKGARFNAMEEALERTLQLVYLDVPMALAYTPPLDTALRSTVYAGPFVGFELSERVVLSSADVELSETSDAYRSPDVGLLVGFDVEAGLGDLDVMVGARYTHGLRNLVENDGGSDSAVRTRTLAFTVGFLF